MKGPDPSYLVLQVGSILPINNWDLAPNVISQRSWPWKLKVIGQYKRHHQIPWPQKHKSRHQNWNPKCISSKVIRTLPPTHKYMCEVLSKSYCQFFFHYGVPIIDQKVAREKGKKKDRKNNRPTTNVDTLWRKLCHEELTWHRSDNSIIWRSFLKVLFGISWVSIHWAFMEIEPLKIAWIATE